MTLDNTRITIPHTKGESLPVNGAFNIELKGCLLKHLHQNIVSEVNYCLNFFHLIDRGWCDICNRRELEDNIRDELIQLDIIGIFVLMEELHDLRVLIITKDTEETMLANQLKKLP